MKHPDSLVDQTSSPLQLLGLVNYRIPRLATIYHPEGSGVDNLSSEID